MSPSPLDSDRYVVSRDEVASYFKTLEELISEHDYDHRKIYYFDETQIFQCRKQSHVKVIANAAARQAYRYHAKSTMHISMCATISANGLSLEPLILIPRKTIPHEVLLDSDLLQMSIRYSENGRMTRSIFEEWVDQLFIPEATARRMSSQDRILLILDGHSSRASVRALESFTRNKIDAVILPAHSSHTTIGRRGLRSIQT